LFRDAAHECAPILVPPEPPWRLPSRRDNFALNAMIRPQSSCVKRPTRPTWTVRKMRRTPHFPSSPDAAEALLGLVETVDLALERRAFDGVPAQRNGVLECGPRLVAAAESGEQFAADRGELVRAGQFAP
jgi:hypothetical protein